MSSASGWKKRRPVRGKRLGGDSDRAAVVYHQKKYDIETYPTGGRAPNSDSIPVMGSGVSSPNPRKKPPRRLELAPTDQLPPPNTRPLPSTRLVIVRRSMPQDESGRIPGRQARPGPEPEALPAGTDPTPRPRGGLVAARPAHVELAARRGIKGRLREAVDADSHGRKRRGRRHSREGSG